MITRRQFLATTAAVAAVPPTFRTASAATTLDLSTVWPEANFHVRNLKTYSKTVAEATGGSLRHQSARRRRARLQRPGAASCGA